MFVTAIAGLMATGSMLAPPATIDVPLKLVKQDKKQGQYMGLSFYGLNKGTQYLRNITVPSSLGITHSALMYFNQDPVAVVAAKDPKQNRFAKIWIDFNRNKKFEDNELAVYTGKDSTYTGYDCYEFKGQPVGPKGKIYARVIASGVQMAGLLSTAAMEGSFEVGGQTATVKVLDTDYDGAYGTKSRYGGDTISYVSNRQQMVTSFDQLLSLSDGRYYTGAVSSTGKSLILTRDETPMGTLAISGAKLQGLSLNCPKGNLSPNIVDGEAKVPATDYLLSYASVQAKGTDGKDYQVDYASNNLKKIKVSANEKTELVFGEDMKLTLAAANAGAGKSFDLTLADKNGFKVSGLYKTGQSFERPKEPEVVIYGPDGSVVDKQTFHYG